MENGQSSRLANYQIGPLYDDNRDEESSVTCQFKLLTLLIGLIVKESKT